jgi:hypothetical protein
MIITQAVLDIPSSVHSCGTAAGNQASDVDFLEGFGKLRALDLIIH